MILDFSKNMIFWLGMRPIDRMNIRMISNPLISSYNIYYQPPNFSCYYVGPRNQTLESMKEIILVWGFYISKGQLYLHTCICIDISKFTRFCLQSCICLDISDFTFVSIIGCNRQIDVSNLKRPKNLTSSYNYKCGCKG